MKKTTHYKGHRWTPEELRTLMRMWSEEYPLSQIAETLQSTSAAVQKMVLRLRKNGIPLKRRKAGNFAGRMNSAWTQGEVEYLIRRRAEHGSSDEIASELGRTRNGVDGMISSLRKEGVPIAMRGCGVRRLWSAHDLAIVAEQNPEANIIQMDSRNLA